MEPAGRARRGHMISTSRTSASVIEVAGPASAAFSRAAELRNSGWKVCIAGTRLSPSCEIVWCLEVERDSV